MESRKRGVTGIIKIGWPGIIIAEGRTDVVNGWTAELKGMKWQRLEVRSEQKAAGRKFGEMAEVESMGELSRLCGEVGAGDIFRVAVGLNSDAGAEELVDSREAGSIEEGSVDCFLLHIDHMNDEAGYLKRLRAFCRSSGLKGMRVFGRSSHGRAEAVWVVGFGGDVGGFLRACKTSVVDRDGSGRKCKERQSTLAGREEVSWTGKGGGVAVRTYDVLDDDVVGDLIAGLGVPGEWRRIVKDL